MPPHRANHACCHTLLYCRSLMPRGLDQSISLYTRLCPTVTHGMTFACAQTSPWPAAAAEPQTRFPIRRLHLFHLGAARGFECMVEQIEYEKVLQRFGLEAAQVRPWYRSLCNAGQALPSVTAEQALPSVTAEHGPQAFASRAARRACLQRHVRFVARLGALLVMALRGDTGAPVRAAVDCCLHSLTRPQLYPGAPHIWMTSTYVCDMNFEGEYAQAMQRIRGNLEAAVAECVSATATPDISGPYAGDTAARERACRDGFFIWEKSRLLRERMVAALQNERLHNVASMGMVDGFSLTQGQCWASQLHDGRHFPLLVPAIVMELVGAMRRRLLPPPQERGGHRGGAWWARLRARAESRS